MSIKKCKVCREPFTPSKPMQRVCGYECACQVAKVAHDKRAAKVAKDDRRETRAKLEKLKSRADWAREAQTAFNAWVRLRDTGKPCISCQRHHNGQIHAGHYLSRGARPELSYEPDNCHAQCAPCNTHLSGNSVLYRRNLVELIGVERVEWLEGPHEPQHYTIDDLREIKARYTKLANELKKRF